MDAARERLLRHGLEGLKVAEVARDVGMSHATVLHHFGSSDEMRAELVERMSQSLLAEFIAALQDELPGLPKRTALLERVFAMLADAKHGQLFAWMCLYTTAPQVDGPSSQRTRELIATLLAQLRRSVGDEQARFVMTLIIGASIGIGVSRAWLSEMELVPVGDDLRNFASQLSALISHNLNEKA